MRAQCCICADLFENSANINIAAVPCGHTFHEECLMRWLETSSTCPSCRKQVRKNQIIKKLFFDITEEEVETADPDQLLNQISSLKAKVCDHAKEKRELAAERDAISETLATCLVSKEEASSKLKQEQRDNLLMKRELASMEKENSLYKREMAQYVTTQKKLRGLENLRLMLEGCEQDVSDMVNCYSDGGEVALKQLSSMVVVVKREYQKALDDKKTLRDQIKMLKIEATQTQVKMGKMKQELKKMQLHLKKSNQDVFSLEQENNGNRRKIAHLRCALKHKKTEGSQSFIAAVNEDSPNVAYTPPSSHVGSNNKSDDKETNFVDNQTCRSPDLFDESMSEETEKKSDYASQVPVAPTSLKMVHISSAAEKFQAAKQAKIESEKNDAPSLPLSNFSIMQKKLTGLSNSRPLALPKFRGFNGLGGSSKIEEPSDTPNRGYLKFDLQKRKLVKKRNPLSQKSLPNQPKLMECMPKKSSCLSSLAECPSSNALKKHPLAPLKKQQNSVTNFFAKSIKTSSSSTVTSRDIPVSSSHTHSTLTSECIDLT